MTEDILINVTPFETRVALVEQGAVQEIHIERSIQRGHVGNLYLGKVVRVLPGMQSAFVDIGLERAAFIHVGDLDRKSTRELQSLMCISYAVFCLNTKIYQSAINTPTPSTTPS